MQHPAWQILGGGGLPEYSLFYRTEHKKIAFELINILGGGSGLMSFFSTAISVNGSAY